MPSRTKKALEMLKAKPELTPYAAAKELGTSPSTICHALSRGENKEICPCCGQVIVRYDDEGEVVREVDQKDAQRSIGSGLEQRSPPLPGDFSRTSTRRARRPGRRTVPSHAQ